jgi:phage terminase large subunit-like protein
MTEEGFPMVEFGATVKNFSEPMKQLEALILTKRIDFEMDPVLMWMFGNVVSHLDATDNVFPRKERPEAKIDGVVAIIMALARTMFHEDDSITVPADYSMVV